MKIYLRFFTFLKPYLRSLVIANIFMLLFVLFSLLSVGLIMPFIDLLFNQGKSIISKVNVTGILNLKDYMNNLLALLTQNYSKETLVIYLCILMITLFLLKNAASYFQTYFMSNVEQGMIKDIRFALYTHFHKLPLGFFTEERKGMLISRIINDSQIIRDSVIAVINSVFRDPPLIITFSLVLFLLNWKLTLLIFALAPVTGLILSKIGNSLKRKSLHSQERLADVTSILDETFGAMRVVKAFSMSQYEIDRYKKADESYFGLIISLVRRRALASPITEVIGTISVTLILFFIGREIVTGRSEMTPGAFFFYLGIFFQMMPSLKLFGQVFNSIQEGKVASQRVFNILDIKPSIFNKPDAIDIKTFNKSIEFKSVSFKYDKSSLILNNINCSINKGEIVAIVGPSGAGKSTFIDLIPRFYDVVNGAVLIDEVDVRDLNIDSLRNLMGMVSQETILFNDTVRNNIAYGSSEIPLEEIIESARAANAHDFIMNMPRAYDTIIGERGLKISGGERQRISIARALLKNPPILILDEATSSLDTESEQLVQQAIERLMTGRTSIVIAHRLSTIRNADKILVLNEGRICEEGKHEQLLQAGGLYKKLYNMQFKV